MSTESRPLHSLTVDDIGHTFNAILLHGSGKVFTLQYQGRFDDGAPAGHEAYRFIDGEGDHLNFHHPDWTLTPCPRRSPHHGQLADALGVDPTDHDWDALLVRVVARQPIFSVREAIAETDLPSGMSSAQAIRTLWGRLESCSLSVDTTREFTCDGRYSVTFVDGDAVVVDSDDLSQGNRARTREWTVPRSGDGWSEVAGDDVWLEVKPAVVVVIHIPWDHKAGPSERVCT